MRRKGRIFITGVLLTLGILFSGENPGLIFTGEGNAISAGSSVVYAAEEIAEEGAPVEGQPQSEASDMAFASASDMASTTVYRISGDKSIAKPTQTQLVARYNSAAGVNATRIYATTPSISNPYSLGRLDSTFVNTGLSYLNFYRYAAGLASVTLDETLMYGNLTNDGAAGAQYGAVLCAVNDVLTHTPSQPSDMDEAFYRNGYSAASSSNISKRKGYDRYNSFRQSIRGCMDDRNSTSNILTMGHRRWFLNPSLGKVGFGYAESSTGASYIVNKIFDTSATPGDYDFISWPASGSFPNDIFTTTTPWSVTLNPNKFNVSSLNSAVITITRASDGVSWTITSANDKSNPVEGDMQNAFFHVNTSYYGINNCLIFQIGASRLGKSDYSGLYNVRITGLKDRSNNDAELNYDVTFFSMGADLSKVTQPSYDNISGTTIYNGVDYSRVYDYTYYLLKYSDLYKAFNGKPEEALKHFVTYGMKEGRQAKANFDVYSYKNKYRDLRNAFGNNLPSYYQHYIKYGYSEGRIATGVPDVQNPVTTLNGTDYTLVYDYNFYISKYPDINRAYGNDDISTLKHFVNYGMKEGRQGKATFELTSYKNGYADLRREYGTNNALYYQHYMKYGYRENRTAVGITSMRNPVTVYNGVDYSLVYDYNYYINKYADLKKAFGYDDAAALKHFVNYGMKEGRQASESFNVNNYKARYADLVRAYGTNLPNYYMHYIRYGNKEGRNGK